MDDLTRIFVHDILVNRGLTSPMNYIDLRVRLQTDSYFCDILDKWYTLLEDKEQDK